MSYSLNQPAYLRKPGNGGNHYRNGGNNKSYVQRSPYEKWPSNGQSSHTPPSEVGSDDGPILFPCIQCKGRLPIKLVDGQPVKRYEDDTCAHCWVANDIIKKPEKYGFSANLKRLLEYLDYNEVQIIMEYTCHTLYADIMTDLYHRCNFDDPVADRDNLVRFLDPIKAYNLPLAVRLHKLVNNKN